MQIKKGMKVQRETVVCERCKSEFERAVVHPYIKTCKDCRGAKKKAFSKIGCVECRRDIATATYNGRPMNRGVYSCGKCEHHWIHIGDGWFKTSKNGLKYLFYKEFCIAKYESSDEVRRLINESEYSNPK